MTELTDNGIRQHDRSQRHYNGSTTNERQATLEGGNGGGRIPHRRRHRFFSPRGGWLAFGRPSIALHTAGRSESATPLLAYTIASGANPDLRIFRPSPSRSAMNLKRYHITAADPIRPTRKVYIWIMSENTKYQRDFGSRVIGSRVIGF